MILKEKIKLQKVDQNRALAFKEGCFYKLYNEGAWFLRHQKYTVQQKGKGEAKALFVGFPTHVLQSLKGTFEVQESDKYCALIPAEDFNNESYLAWCKDKRNEIHNRNASLLKEATDDTALLLAEIVNYSLVTKTPLQVVSWLSDVQDRLSKRLVSN